MPVHWNSKGEADRFGNKWAPFFMSSFTNIFTYLILIFAPKIDTKNIEKFGDNYIKIRIGLQYFMMIVTFVILFSVQGIQFNSAKIIMGAIGLLFAFMGNFLISVKPNYVLGFRSPWTLENETVWRKTHQLGGKFWFYGGLIIAGVSCFLESQQLFVILISFVVLSILIIYGYAFKLYKEITPENKS